jgi:hypothetical protein
MLVMKCYNCVRLGFLLENCLEYQIPTPTSSALKGEMVRTTEGWITGWYTCSNNNVVQRIAVAHGDFIACRVQLPSIPVVLGPCPELTFENECVDGREAPQKRESDTRVEDKERGKNMSSHGGERKSGWSAR